MKYNENMQEYQTSIQLIDETVEVAREFLKSHPDEIETKNPINHKKATCSPAGKIYYQSPEAFQIAEFLGWGEHKVHDSIERLDLGVSWI